MKKAAPLFTRSYSFYSWLLDHFEKIEHYPQLKTTVLDNANKLMEAITLALQGYASQERVLAADEALALLRLHLRMAEDKKMLTEKQYRFVVETMDDIGKQIGGWQKSMNKVS